MSGLPDGFVLDQTQAAPVSATGLPDGFVLDNGANSQPAFNPETGARRIYITGQPDIQPQPAQQPSGGLGDALADVGKSIVSKGAEGLIGLAGMPGDLVELGARGLDRATRGIGSLVGADIAPRADQEATLGSGQIKHAIEGMTGKFYEPQTTAGKYAGSVAEMLPAMIGGPESLATKFATRALVPGLASEGAGQATKGTALEPLARVGGAVLGGIGAAKALAPSAIAAPTAEALESAAKSAYNNPTVAALELHPSSTAYAAGKITDGLNKGGFRSLTAPQTFGLVQELKTPLGPTAKIADIQSVRTALGKVAGNFANPVEQAAANKAIRGIDDYLANLKPFDVAAGDAKAAASILNEAKGNYAASKRVSRLDDADYRASLNAASAHSGGNINNATRQALKSILISDKKRRGFSADEIAQMEKIVKGTFTGNMNRIIGKVLATTGMHGGLTLAGSIAAAPATHGLSLALPALGFAGKKLANRSTAKAIAKLDQMTAMRSPLGQSLPLALPSTNPTLSGLLSGLTEARNRRLTTPN